MSSTVFDKPFPSAFKRAFKELLARISTMLLGVFCMTTRQIQKFTSRVKNVLPFALTGLVVLTILATSNIFVTNQVSAQSTPYMSIKWWHRTNNFTLCPDTNNDAEERCHHEDTITIFGTETMRSDFYDGAGYNTAIKTDPTNGQRLEGVVRHLGHDAQKWTAQLKWFLKEDQLGNAAATEVGSTEITSVASTNRHRIDSPYGYWDLWAQSGVNAVSQQWWYPNVNGIKNLPPGSVATLELIGRIPDRNNLVNRFSNKLFIRHNTSATWDAASRNTSSVRDIAEQPNSSTINDERTATIATHESDFTNFSYKSKHYVGTNSAAENALTQEDVDPDWTNEWTYNTPYGRWIVGTPTGNPITTGCGSLKCQNVKFKPNMTALNGVTGSLKLELEINLTKNGMVVETDNLVYVLNIPTFSISAVSDSYDEDDGMAQFKVTSNINPGTDTYMVNFTPTEISGNFFDDSDGESGDSRMESLTFMAGQDGSGNTEYTTTIDVELRDLNELDEANGTIKVELDRVTSTVNNISFAVAKAPNNVAEVTIKDKNVPVITIDNAENIVASQVAMFPLTADIQPRQPLMIRYTPTEIGSNFLAAAGGTSTQETMKIITFTEQADKSGKAFLPIETKIDSTASIGSLKILLLADSDANANDKTYEISGTNLSRTKTVAISAYPIVTISIEQADDTINEGESIEVTFIADADPERSDFPLPYTITDSSSTHYLKDDSAGNGSGDTRTATLNFEENLYTGKWEAKITVETKTADDVDRPHGTLTVQLVDPGSSSFYRIDNDVNKQKMAIRVLDSKKWTITIADGPLVKNFNNGQIPDASFPMTINGPPTGGGIDVKYRRIETGGNFLATAITENETLSKRVTFSGGGNIKNGDLTIDLEDDGRDDSERSTVTIVLLEDPVNYNLSNNASERTGSVMVQDPSYSEINTFHNNTELTLKDNGPVDDWRIHDVTLFIKDTPTDYEIDHFARVVNYEDDNFTHDLDWYVSDSTYASTINSGTTALKSTQADTHTTDYGDWVLNAGWNSNPWDYTTADFNISRAQIDAIPLGAKARLKANLYVPTNVEGNATIDLIPNTQVYWKSSTHTKSNIITEDANTYENGTRKEGTIVTFQDPLSDLVFKSKLYDGSTTAVEATLMDAEVESAWTNMEKTHTTDYGRWVVGNQLACMSGANDYIGDANCYDVRFEPNLDNINKINSKIVKLDLEVSITGETDTISYIIVDEGIKFELDNNNSNIIKATGSSPTIDDMDGTVTVTKRPTDTFTIETKQSTDNANTETTGTDGAMANMDAGFSSIEYGSNLSLGSWYFEDSDASTTSIPRHTTNAIVTRNFKFIPDDSAIGTLAAGEQRYSTITVKVMRSTNVISTESYTVSIYKADKPTFRIFATDNSKSIDEGGTISLNVVADSDPGTTSVSISYTAVNTVGNFLATTDHDTPKMHMLTNISQDSGASTYSGDTFPLQLRTANTTDDTDGIISIKLNNPTGSLSSASAAYVTDPSNVAIVEVKDLSATVPTITFENADPVNQGSPAEFMLTADIKPHAPLAIRFKATNTTGSFLDQTNGLSGIPQTVSSKIMFSDSSPYTGTLSIPTILDKATGTGTISVTLLPDPNTNRQSYKLSGTPSEHTKTVQVSRAAISRTISVDNTTINVNEGETATVTFIASDDPGRSDLMIKYTPDETSTGTSYLKVDGVGNGDNVTRTAELDFEEVNNRWVAEVEIETNKNDMDQIHGVISVSLDTTGISGYTVTSNSNEQSVTINVKDLTVPTITIADAADVISGTAASFILTSDIQPKPGGLIFQYTPTETGSNFLMTGHSGPSPSINFSGDPIVGTLSIPTRADASVKSGEISIQLMADSNTSDPSYKIIGDANANTKKVRVAANPIREISFEDRSVDIAEAGMATITLLADDNPMTTELVVKYTPTEKSSDTSYLKITDDSGTSQPDGETRMATLNFQEDTSTNPSKWKATITIKTNDDDGEDNKDGLIEVVLDTPSAQDGYTIADSPNNSILVNVEDGTVPEITIEDAPNVEPAGIARFKLTASHEPHEALRIRYTPNETSSTMYLNTAGGASEVTRTASPEIKFTEVAAVPPSSTSTYEGILSIPTVLDENNIGTNGTIEVKLEADSDTDDPSYNITGTDDDNTKSVSIQPNVTIPTVEIEFEQTTMNVEEGDKMVEIKVILNEDPVRTMVPIKYTPTVSGTDFLDTTLGAATVERPVTLSDFQTVPNTTKFSATFKIDTKDDNGNDEANGVITLTLSDPESGDKYTLNNAKKVLTINVKDGTVPTITIANADKIVAPSNATFTLTADPQPKGPLTIRVTPTETGTSFLSPAFGTSTTPKDITSLNFSGQSAPFTETFDVQTVLDNNNSNGIINIEILADSNTTDPAYKISTTPSENTGKVSVFSYSSIELSIEDEISPVDEGDTGIEITVTASTNPGVENIPVQFTPTNTTGSFLKTTDDSGTSLPAGTARTAMLTFTNTAPQGSAAKWQDTFTIDTNTVDDTFTGSGEIEVKLKTHDRGNYTVKTPPADHVDITVIDADNPTITIGSTTDLEPFHESVVNNVYQFRHELTLVSDTPLNAALNVKYSLTETGTNFLRASNPNNKNITFAAANPPTDPQTYLGTLPIELVDDVGEARGIYVLTLQEDISNYTLGTGMERTRSITVNDPSYILANSYRFNHGYTGSNTLIRDPEGLFSNDNDVKEAFLYIREPSINHEVFTTTRVLEHEMENKITLYANWYFNDSTTAEGRSNTLSNTDDGVIMTDIGNWDLPDINWGGGNPHRVKYASKFIITSAKLENLPLDSRGRIELNFTIPDGVTDKSTLHIIQNTTSYWNSDISASITGTPNTYDVGVPKFATIKTYHDTLTELGFESKLYDGSATSVDATLSETNGVWTHTTTYGTWTIDNQRVCEAATTKIKAANCYDVKFDPNLAAINNISNKIVKLDLKTSISGSNAETDTISYIIVGEDIQIALDDNNTNIIDASSATTFSNVDSTLTTSKQSGDTFAIEVKETTDNAGTYSAVNLTKAGTNSDAGFSADQYDLNLGKWFFATADTDAVAIPGYSTNSTVSRKLRFDPDDSAITGLSTGEVRYATITVKTMRSTTEINSVTFTVAIYRSDKPIFTISAVDTAVNEGESVTLKVTTDTDPSSSSFDVKYTPTNVKGSLSTETSITETAVTFTADSGSNPQTWSKEFEFQLRGNNSVDEENGIVSIKLDRIMDALTNANIDYTTDPNNTATISVKDLTVPKITFVDAPAIQAPADAVFTLTATPKPWQPLAIRYTPTNSMGSFLDTTDGASGAIRMIDQKLTFTDSSGNGTATLSIPTIIDGDNSSGEISVEILADLNTSDTSYNIDTTTPANNTRTVSIGVTYPTVELEIDQTPIKIIEGNTATITVITNVDPVRTTLPISITATGDYLDPSVDLTPDLTSFQPVSGGPKYSATFTVATVDDMADGEHGSITVTLATPGQGANYTLGTNTSITFDVIDATKPVLTFENAPEAGTIENHTFTDSSNNSQTIRAYLAKFPVTATTSVSSLRPITVKYTATETGTNFLDDNKYTGRDYRPVQNNETYNAGEVRTGLIKFTDNSGTLEGTLEIPLVDPNGENSGTISITLQEDSDNYALPTQTADRTRTVAVKDPSFLKFTFRDNPALTIDNSNRETATIYIKDTSATYSIFRNDFESLSKDVNSGKYQVKWYLNNTFVDETMEMGKNSTLTSPYGSWKINNYLGPDGSGNSLVTRPGYNDTQNRFEPNQTGINGVPAGSKARVELHTEAPHQAKRVTTLNILHNTTTLWSSNSTNLLTKAKSAPDIATALTGTIKTYHDTQSELSFKSIQTVGTNTPAEVTLTETSGTWTHATMNTYGTWTINNQRTCDTDATCYDVSFAPDSTQIGNLTANSAIQLETTITPSGGSTIETDTLTFNVLAEFTKQMISINGTSIDINEAGTATITLTADDDPVIPLDISYTPTETSTGTSYLKDDDDGNGSTDTRTERLEFMNTAPQGAQAKWEATIEIETERDDLDKIDGVIEVVLNSVAQDADYSIGTNPADRITINVNDLDVPLISIEDAPNAILPNAAQFTLTSDIQPREALTIRYKPKNITGNFLEVTTNGANDMPRDVPTPISFAPPSGATTPITGTLMVPTTTDASNVTGTFTVELLADSNNADDPTYRVGGTDDIKTVKVFKYPIVELSIEANSMDVDEGNEATIKVTVSENPIRMILPIKFTPTEASNVSSITYLKPDANNKTSGQPRDFTLVNFLPDPDNAGKYFANITVDTNDIPGTADKSHGVITVTLDDPASDAGYTVGTNKSITLNVIDDIKPEIIIGTDDPKYVVGSVASSIYNFRNDIKLVSDTELHAPLTVKINLTETSGNYLKTPFPTEKMLTFTRANPPTDPETYLSTLELDFVDDADNASGTYTLTLQDDSNNYTLGTGAEKAKTFTVNDPSYFNINTYRLPSSSSPGLLVKDPANEFNFDNDAREAALYILDPTVDHRVNNTTWILEHEINMLTVSANWYLNGSTTGEGIADSETNVGHGTFSTDIGKWVLPSGNWDNRHSPHNFNDDSRFEMTSSELAKIPLDSRARIELDVSVPTGVTNKSILHIYHNTASYWNSDKSATLEELPNNADIGDDKVGTIKTYHTPVSELSFKSKLYDGSANATEATLTETSGEWTHMTSYGEWIVNNQRACPNDSDAMCFDVTFEPSNNGDELKAISGKTVKFELESTITSNSNEIEKDILTYQVIDYSTTFALATSGSNEITVDSGTTTYGDVTGTATIFKGTTDTLSIETKETTTNQDTPTTPGTDSTNTNTDAVFTSKEYGENLTLGSWYVEEVAGLTPVADPADSNFHTIMPRFLFRPDSTALLNLEMNSVRKSTLTIKTLDGSDTIVTQEITVTITRGSPILLPIFSIEVVTDKVGEGGTAQFKIVSDRDPGAGTFTVNYTPTDTAGNHIDPNEGGVTNTTRMLSNFTFDPPSSQEPRYTETFDIELRDADTNDNGPGTLTVVLDPVVVDQNSTYAVAIAPGNSAVAKIKDANAPTITISNAPNVTAETMRENEIIHASFPITASTAPVGGSLMVIYTATTPSGNFLGHAVDTPTTTEVTFTGVDGILKVPTMDDSSANSGTIQVVLQDDNLSYNLGATDPAKTGMVTVNDPSFVRVDTFSNNVSVDASDGEVVTLYYKDSPADYTITHKTHALATDVTNEDITFEASWYLDDSSTAEGSTATPVTGKTGSLDTPYGDWTLEDSWTGTGPERSTDAKFEITRAEIDTISVGSKARIDLNFSVPNSVTNTATLHLVPNTTVFWNNTTDTALAENRNTANFTTNKEATITTYNENLSTTLSFESKLYEGNATPTDVTVTAGNDIQGGWSGPGWSAQTTYGQWIIGNEQDCETGAKCYSVRFVPDASEIDKVKDKVLRFELISKITENSTEVESDTITYTIEGSGVNVAVDANNSSTINSPATAITLADVNATASLFAMASDTFTIDVEETTSNSATPTTEGTVTSTPTNNEAGFDSEMYVTDLTLGSWYFAKDNTGLPVADGLDSDFQVVSRDVLFRPNPTAIANLPVAAIRTSTLTINVVRNDTTISSNTFVVTINRINTPAFSISAPEAAVIDGGTLEFTVTADADPGTTAIDISYRVSEESGDFLAASVTKDSSLPISLPFQPASGANNWVSRIPIALKAANMATATSGLIKVTLEEPADNSVYFVAKAPNNEATAIIASGSLPVISIADAPVTFNGESAVFELSSNVVTAPGTSIDLRFRPTKTNGNFLDETDEANSADWTSGTIREMSGITFAGASAPYTTTLSIDTDEDANKISGSFMVELVEDDANPQTYAVDPNKKTATVTVYRLPTLSIAPLNEEVEEGGQLIFVVTADFKPRTNQETLSFKYTISEDNSSFLDPSVTKDTELDATDIVFTGTGLTNYTARLPIALKTRSTTDTENGSISIALVQPSPVTDFEVNTTPASVTILKAALPELSIEQTNMNIDEGGTASITVTASLEPETKTFDVSFIPTESAGTSYLKDDDLGNGTTDKRTVSLTFENNAESGSPAKWEATFPLATNADDFDMPNGVITVVLASPPPNANFTVKANPGDRITINVKDLTVPAISIVNAPDVVALKDAEFALTASTQPHQPLTIRFIPTNTTGDFLAVSNNKASGDERTEDVTFSPPDGATTPITGILPVPTTIDEDENTGVITIQLLADSNTDDPSYSLGDQTPPPVTVAVTNPVIPEISITNAELTLNGQEARFTLTSNIETGQHTITIKPSNNSGSFFDPDSGSAAGRNRTVDVTFTESNGTYTAPLIIKTRIDNSNASGEIEVELIDESTTNSYNIVNNQKTATVQVYRVRTLSIESAVPHVIEGVNELVFSVTSDINPNNEPVIVTYTVMEVTTDFLAGSITPGEQAPIALTFDRTNATSTWIASIPVPLRGEAEGNSGTGTITVSLNPVDSVYEVAASPDNNAIVKTYDKSLIPTLNIIDMDASIKEGDVDSNSTLEFTVELTMNPQTPLIVQYQVASYTGDAKRAIRGRDFTLDPGDLDFQPDTNLTQKISVPVIDDDLIEPVEEFHVEISVPENSLVMIGQSIGVGTIVDNDQPEDPTPKPFIYIEAQNSVIEEGDSAIFIIQADRPAPDHTSAIRGIGLNISQGEEDDFIGWRVPRQITIPEEENRYQISIATVDDSVDEANGEITATITAGDDINLNREDAVARVTVNDNDETTVEPVEQPRISVADVAVNSILENIDNLLGSRTETAESPSSIFPTISVVAVTTYITEGENAEFNLITSDNLTGNLIVTFVVNQNGDFLTEDTPSQVQLPSTAKKARIVVNTQDDQNAEGDGSITLQLKPNSTYKISSQNSATVAVSDAVDRQARKDEIASRSSEILPEILNLVGSNALARTSQRIQQAQGSSGLGVSYRINGAQDLKQIITTSGEMINAEPESLRSILGNSEFAFDVYSEDNLTNPVSVWGLGELRSVNSTGGVSGWQGDAFTGHFGFDTKLSPNTLMGMTTSVIDMDAGYALKQNNEFIFQSRNTTFNPYLNWTSQNNDAQLQTIVGYGFGAIDIKQPNYQYETLQSYSSAISVNGRKQLYASDSLLTGGTSTLSLVGESWITQLQVAEKQDIIDAMNLSAQHHRIAVDGSHNITLDNGSSIKPTLSIGLLHDGKNQDALQGVELRNSISYSNAIGIGLAGNARLILEPSSQARLWNLNGSLDFDYGRDQLGAMLNITGTYSHGQENYTDLLNMSILDGVGSNTMDKAINTELQYGLKVCGNICQVTPYAGYNYNLDKANSAQFGTRFSVGTLLNLEYEGSYNPNSDTTTNQKVQLNSRISW